jgi:hypothetical protein
MKKRFPCSLRKGLPFAVLVLALAAIASLGVELSHTLDEVHGFNNYAQAPWGRILTRFNEPGHHLLHNAILKLVHPLGAGTPLALRWPTILYALAFLLAFSRLLRPPPDTGGRGSWPGWPGVYAPLLPLCFGFFQFYAFLSRGYMLGLLCLALLLIASLRYSHGAGERVPWATGAAISLTAAGAPAAVLSNGLFAVGAGTGFLLLDLKRRRYRQLVSRAGFLLAGAALLVLVQPATRHLERVLGFQAKFGRRLESAGAVLEALGATLLQYLEPWPLPAGALLAVGIAVLARRRRALLLVLGFALFLPVAWALFTGNALYHRSFFAAYLILLLPIAEGLHLLLCSASRQLAPAPPWGRHAVAALVLVGLLAALPAARERASLHFGAWGRSIPTREWIETEGEYDFPVMPWGIFQAYAWEMGPRGWQRLESMLTQRRVDALRVLSYAGQDQLTFGNIAGRAGQRHGVSLEFARHWERDWGNKRASYRLPGGRLAGVWRDGGWEQGDGRCSGRCLTLLLHRGRVRPSPDFEGLPVTSNLLDYPFPAGARVPRAYLVLEGEAVSPALKRFGREAGPVLVFTFPIE